jgi:hypothetical protein
MRLLQSPKHLLQQVPSTYHVARLQNTERSAQQQGSNETANRHDAQMLTARARASADPYKAWLEQREANREREERRLNPRAAWDDLRTQTFCSVGRG